MPHPPRKGSHLTTAEAAALLKISPATLKRWARSGLIPSERTEGGHRRYRLEDVQSVGGPPDEAGDPVGRGADFLLGGADPLGVQSWLLQARRELGSWWAVAEPLRGVVAELYRRGEAGAAGRVQLEAALDRLRIALVRFCDALTAPPEAPVLLVAAVPGDPYLVAPALIQLAAAESGWRAEWAGHPEAADLAVELRRRPARAVVVCASVAASPALLGAHTDQLERLAAGTGVALAILGTGDWPVATAPLTRLGTVADLPAWLSGLRRSARPPGPVAEPEAEPGDLPPELRWDPALALGHATVDAQHETLFLHADRLVAAVRRGEADAGELLVFVGDYAQAHFRTEENLMRVSGYPALGEHLREHEQFARRLALLTERLEGGSSPEALTALARFLVDWLRAHVGRSDQRIGEHLRGSRPT